MNLEEFGYEILIKMYYEVEQFELELSDRLYEEYDEKYSGKKEVWEEIFNMKYDKFWCDILRENRKILYEKVEDNLEEFYNKIIGEKANLRLEIDEEIKSKLEG